MHVQENTYLYDLFNNYNNKDIWSKCYLFIKKYSVKNTHY